MPLGLSLLLIGSTVFATDYKYSLESYVAIRATPRAASKDTSAINADNRTFQLASGDLSYDLRPELKTQFAETSKLVLRPRFLAKAESYSFTNPEETKTISQGRWQLSDFYLENIWSESFRTTLGLQTYQWGPAELLNPSNPLFHFSNNQKSAFYKEKGQPLIKANLDPSQNLSLLLIIEPVSNNESPWMATANADGSAENFYPKGLLRGEWRSSQGLNNLGIVLGKEERQKNFIGETATYSPAEGLSVYFDGKQTEAANNFLPTANNYGGDSLANNPKNSYTQLAIVGARIEGANYDLRFEVVDNQAGWDKSDWTRILRSLKTVNPDTGINYSRFAKPGLELFSQRYYYLSLRLPNLGKKQDWNAALRYLLSDLDGSSSLQTAADWNISDSWTGYLEALTPFGSSESDLNFTGQSSYLLGLKWNL